MTMADAACAQQRLVDTLRPVLRGHGRLQGRPHQRAAQARFGVPHPIRGTIFHGTIRATGTPARPAEIPAAFGVMPR
jgi:hypothetical protein